jgi:phage FluMu gp28-like protein
MQDRTMRIPYDPVIRSDLRSVTKQTTAAGNIRFTAERTPDGHADRFWALALAKHAASNPSAPIEFQSTGPRLQTRLDGPGVVTTDVGFGTVPGSLNLRGF